MEARGESLTENVSNSGALELIENRLKDPSILSHREMKAIATSLTAKIGKEALLAELKERLDAKQVFYIRHAQSTYNKWAQKSVLNFAWTYSNKIENYDPVLTPEGVEQCRERVAVLDKEKPFEAELVMVSPLTRAIQTMNELKKSVCLANPKKTIVTQLLRERLDACGDIGKTKAELQDQFKELDFSFINKERWWNYLEDKDVRRNKLGAELFSRESEDEAKARVALIFLWIVYRPEKTVVMVSHSGFYRAIFDITVFGKKAKNTQCIRIESERILSNIKNLL